MPVYLGPLVQILPHARSKYSFAARLTGDDIVELLIFADRIGLARCWLINGKEPRFDLTPGLYRKAIKHGAVRLGEHPTPRSKRRPRLTPLWEGLEA